MKLGISCFIYISILFVAFKGTAAAHPHELGILNHGPSIENYQVDLDFTKNNSLKILDFKNLLLAKKNQIKHITKNDNIIKSYNHNKPKILKIKKPKLKRLPK